MLWTVDSGATPGTSSPLTDLLYGQVQRVLARWQEMDGDKSPAPGTVERFVAALAALEEAADGLTGDGAPGDGAPRVDPSPLADARSYAHLAGLLPRSLERSMQFDAAACVIKRPGGELVIDAISPDPVLADLATERVLQLLSVLVGGREQRGLTLPPRPAVLRASLYVPLVAGGIVVGATYVASLREDAFTPEDERLLGELAAHTTGAFQRVDGKARALRTTARQAQVLSLIAAGLSDKEIAARLGVSPRTVRTHLERFLREHRMSSRTEAATAWLRGEHQS